MPVLNREALLALTTLRTVTVHIPETDSDMILREMTGRDLMQLQERTGKSFDELRSGVEFGSALDILAWMLRFSWVDEAGNLIMGDEDVARIINMPLSAMMMLVNHVTDPLMLLNGLTPTAVEDAQKN